MKFADVSFGYFIVNLASVTSVSGSAVLALSLTASFLFISVVFRVSFSIKGDVKSVKL